MSLSAPSSPDPMATSNQQSAYNTAAGQQQQKMNMVNQSTPYGSLNYTADPNSPSGYSANVSLTPQQQQLLNTQQGTQQTIAGAGANLGNSIANKFSNGMNLDPSTMTNTTMAMENQYLQPWFNQQNSNMTAQLANEGFAPGTEAYTNAMRGLTEGQQGTMANTFLQAEPMAFNQAIQSYTAPLQAEGSMFGLSSPTGPNFQQTPQEQIQPPNYAGLAQSNYQNQMQQYGNTMSGLSGIASAGVGGWARAGFPGAGSMFSSAPGAAGAASSVGPWSTAAMDAMTVM
jgi:hypothetical protein